MRLLCFAVLLILYTFSFIEYFPSNRNANYLKCACVHLYLSVVSWQL